MSPFRSSAAGTLSACASWRGARSRRANAVFFDAKGAAHEVHRHRLAPAAARRWTDASCSLEASAGQTIELRLSTETVAATSEEKLAAARQREAARRAEADAGAPGRRGAPDAASATTVATEAVCGRAERHH
ncbi:hypothetical protein [Salmonella enterica]|uniref:hypothetical protein n=1 Tax=Salmonella enterica TaxID=28901 RepID=UPI001CA4CCB2|nr:hypothetical protein [Salmonella enterica]